jgi:hypothetical protein
MDCQVRVAGEARCSAQHSGSVAVGLGMLEEQLLLQCVGNPCYVVLS